MHESRLIAQTIFDSSLVIYDRLTIDGQLVASALPAIKRANSTKFGLGAGVMTTDLSRAHRVADALISGNVWVNSFNILLPSLPFGGATHSDLGRENSINTLDAYSEVKSVHITL